MTRRANLALLPVAIVAVLATSVESSAATKAEGKIKQWSTEGDDKILILDGNKMYRVPGKLWARHKKEVKKGESITFWHTGKGEIPRVLKIERKKSNIRRKTEQSGTIKLKYNDKRGLLELTNGTYPVDIETIRKNKRALQILLTVRKGQKVIYWLIRGRVVDIAKGAKGREVKAEVARVLSFSKAGDDVHIRLKGNPAFTKYRLRRRSAALKLSPYINNKPSRHTIIIERWKIDEVKNTEAIKRMGKKPVNGGQPANADPIQLNGVRRGDMIALGFDTGQVLNITDETVELRLWLEADNTWGKIVKKPRKKIEKVFFEKLTSQETLSLQGGVGELELKVDRSRKQGGSVVFDIELNHTGKEVILVNLKLTFRLSREPTMDRKAAGDQMESRAISVPLFAEQRHTIRHEVSEEEFMDGRVLVNVNAVRNIVSISDPDARQYLIQALGSTKSLGALEGIYQAAATNGDKDIARFLVGRLLMLPKREKNKVKLKDHMLAIRKALSFAKYRDLAPQLILEEVMEHDNSLRRFIIRKDKLEPVMYSDRPTVVKRSMIALLGDRNLPNGLKGKIGVKIFDLSWQRKDQLQTAIDDAWAKKPDDAVAAILPIAIDQPIDTAAQSRTDNAKEALKRLGENVINSLLKKMNQEGLKDQARELKQSWINGHKPGKVVEAAVDLLAGLADDRKARELQRMTDEAESYRTGVGADKNLTKGLEVLRAVLKKDKEFAAAREMLPKVLIDLAKEKQKSGARGEAAVLYQEAMGHLKGAKKSAASMPLAKLMIEGAREDTDEIVVRTHPIGASAKLIAVRKGQSFEGKPAGLGWVQVTTKKGDGYIRKVCVSGKKGKKAKGSKYTVSVTETPFATVKEELDSAKELAPGLENDANQAYGTLCAREGELRYEDGDYAGALHFLEEAAQYAPSDPRLSLKWKCWVKANTVALAAVAAVVLLALGIASLQAFSKPSKVKFKGEFKHYGSDRSARERDLDIPE